MEKQKDPGPVAGIAGLLAAAALVDFLRNEGRNIQKAIEWYHWLRSLDLIVTPAEIAAQQAVAPAVVASTGLSPLAQLLVLVGMFMIAAAVFMAFSDKMKGGKRDSTLQVGEGPTKTKPAFKPHRSIISRNGARKVE